MSPVYKASAEAISFFGGESEILAAEVWFNKYCLKDRDGVPQENTFLDSCKRWDRALGFGYNELSNRDIILGGSIAFALGNRFYPKASLKNCYVIPIKEDSIEAIYDCNKEMARVYSHRGGCGTSISGLRPRGHKVSNCAGTSSGAVSFMELFSTTTGTIGQNGRRGAQMLTISSDHPDIEEFISIKADVKDDWIAAAKSTDPDFNIWLDKRRSVRYANISVQLSDRFLEAVVKGTKHKLQFPIDSITPTFTKEVDARELWDKIVRCAWQSAEPGLIFWDAMRRESPSDYYGDPYKILSTNPCAEQALEPYGNCNLGHVNLSNCVDDPFTVASEFDGVRFRKLVRTAVRMLDRVNSIEDIEDRYPLSQMQRSNLDLRRIGLGITGFGDMLIKLGITYGSQESIDIAEDIARILCETAYDESAELAREYAPFKVWDPEIHKQVPIFKRLPKELQEKILKYGLRNCVLLTLAPVGTGSIIAQTSSGVEPLFALEYDRRVETATDDKKTKIYRKREKIVRDWAVVNNVNLDNVENLKKVLPECFITSHDINWENRVKIQAAFQNWIDASISSTINLPNNATVDDVKTIYLTAWKAGCKGVTVYREGCRDGVLKTIEEAPKEEPATESTWEELPDIIEAKRLAFRDGNNNRVLLTVGLDPISKKTKEVVISHGKTEPELDSISKALGIVTSIALQQGVEPERLAKALRGIKAGWLSWNHLEVGETRRYPIASVPDAIAAMLMKHGEAKHTEKQMDYTTPSDEVGEIPGASMCSQCGIKARIKENGCFSCKQCGASACG